MPIQTEIDAFADYDAGIISREDLIRSQDIAARDSIQKLEATGETYATDGEQRVSSFATYPVVECVFPEDFVDVCTLQGAGLSENLGADGQMFAYFNDGHYRQLPRLISGPFKYTTYAWQNLEKSIPYATGPMKQAVISPSMMYLLYPLVGEIEGYSRDEFVKDLVDECQKDIRGCFRTGAKRVSIDFTEGRLALRKHGDNPWTGANLLEQFVFLINSVLERFSTAERANIGLHTCPGGDCDSTHSADVAYHELLPSLFRINAGYFLIQLSSEADREDVYKEIGAHLRPNAGGVKQVAFIGVTNPLNPRIESPSEIAEQLELASKYIPHDQLGATDDCGFSPFSIDTKPKHGSPDKGRDIAILKITNRVQGAKLASERLGL